MELNLRNAIKNLVIKALQKYRTRKEASEELGISMPTLRKMVIKYQIK